MKKTKIIHIFQLNQQRMPKSKQIFKELILLTYWQILQLFLSILQYQGFLSILEHFFILQVSHLSSIICSILPDPTPSEDSNDILYSIFYILNLQPTIWEVRFSTVFLLFISIIPSSIKSYLLTPLNVKNTF